VLLLPQAQTKNDASTGANRRKDFIGDHRITSEHARQFHFAKVRFATLAARVDLWSPSQSDRSVASGILFRMAKRFALVTGGNRGLGLETARQLVLRGYRVLTGARDVDLGERSAKEIGAEFVPLDITNAKHIASLADRLRTEPPLDALVNNAGISMKGFDRNVARGTLDANFLGPVHLTGALNDRLAPKSNVVMVSSGLGQVSCLRDDLAARFSAKLPTREEVLALVEKFVADVANGTHTREGWPTSAYSVSKAALNAWTRILANELAPKGIRVNAVNPGWVRTNMGGSSAPRSVEQGAAGIVWAATLEGDGPTGGFFTDGEPSPW